MAINDQVSFTWVGHGTWRVRSARGKEILIDPWVMHNPVAPEHLKKIDRCDIMVVTHGHVDHIGYLPKLVRDGFKGAIYAATPTRAHSTGS